LPDFASVNFEITDSRGVPASAWADKAPIHSPMACREEVGAGDERAGGGEGRGDGVEYRGVVADDGQDGGLGDAWT